MWLFKRKAKSRVDNTEHRSVGTKIGRGIMKVQTAFAKRMNAAAAGLPVKKLKRNLVIFCLVSGGFSIYLAMNGLFGSNHRSNAITIDQASVPKHFDKSGDEIRNPQNIIDEDLYQQVRMFRVYMDSLQKNNKPGYDSIILLRPGLIDSIQTIEEIYLSQKIK